MADRATFTLGPALGTDGKPTADAVSIGSSDLTTHGVVVGMTGSGKTGLAVVLLEEALSAGIPAIVLDPKGDMGNLALVFPDLEPASFRPWVNEAEAQTAGLDVDAYAAKVAAEWKAGLEAAGIGAERLQALRDAADVTVYTPGSTAGAPLNVIGSLSVPALSWETEAETLRDEIQGTVTSLLGLIGVDADPLASREHVLLANLVENAWRAGRDLDLGSLIAEIQTPPIRKLGVFELDQFFPQKDRTELAFRFNALVASPTFAAWGEGNPLDIQALLFHPDGRPRCAVVYLAHLSDAERQFVVTLVFSKLVTWMRGQSGTPDLRALAYMDEVYGYLPPTGEPPTKKPILTIFKQGRAFGLGLVLSTQNPVDVDYKAMSNAGTWFVGRLQTENDKARVLEGLRSASGDTDVAALDRIIGGLGKRQFLLVSAKSATPRLLTTRWAMSYLRGPLTKEQLRALPRAGHRESGVEERSGTPGAGDTSAAAPRTPGASSTADGATTDPAASPAVGTDTVAAPGAPAAGATPADDTTPVAPTVAKGIAVAYVDPAAPWAAGVGATPGSSRLSAALAFRCSLRYDDTKAGLDELQEWEAIVPLDGGFDLEQAVEADYDDRDFLAEPPPGASYVLPDVALEQASFYKDATTRLQHRLVTGRVLEIQTNAPLKLWSRPGESAEDFARRCREAADAKADEETAKLTDKLGIKRERLEKALRTAQERMTQAEAEASSRRQRELVSGAGELLGSLFGGRRSTRGLSKMANAMGGSSAGARADAAEARADDATDDLATLEQELAAGISEIADRWDAVAEEVTTVPIRLEASDVKVLDTRLVWIPST